MYRIIIVSDTHRHLEHIVAVLDNIREFDMIIHLGDNTDDARKLSGLYPEAEMISVQGNTDFPRPDTPLEVVREIDGVRVFAAHGHMYGVKGGTTRIFYRGKEIEAKAVFFGHTHIPVCEKEDGMWLLNPGGHNSLHRSIGIAEIENGKVKCCLYPC